MEQRRRQWFVGEVKKVWRVCGGTGGLAYYKAPTQTDAAKFTGPLLDLIVELLDQFGAPQKLRSRKTLLRAIKGKR
jgi:hypothetical protein